MTDTIERAEMVPTKNTIALEYAPFTYETLRAIARTEFVPKGLRGNVPAILAAVMTGREMGLPPMESIRCIDMIDGNPTPGAELLDRLIKEKGHRIVLVEQTAKRCELIGMRRQDPQDIDHPFHMRVEATIEEYGHLANKPNWKQYAKAMLFWRCVTMLARQHFPDAVGAARLSYMPGEIAGDFDEVPPEIPVDIERVDEEPALDPEDAWVEAIALVGPNLDASKNMPDIEADVRRLYRLMGATGEWSGVGDDDRLHVDLSAAGVVHVSDLRKVELVAFAEGAWERARQAIRERPFEDDE